MLHRSFFGHPFRRKPPATPQPVTWISTGKHLDFYCRMALAAHEPDHLGILPVITAGVDVHARPVWVRPIPRNGPQRAQRHGSEITDVGMNGLPACSPGATW